MKYTKLNNVWHAVRNVPNSIVNKYEDCVELIFDLNPFIYENIDEGDKGVLEFQEVYKFHNGTMNDEGYFNGNHRYKNDNLPWGEFYELSSSNWETEFPIQANVINDNIDKNELKHYIFFLRDQEIECLAMDYFFHLKFKDEELYSEKYPHESFDHYLSMFGINQSDSTEINFQDQIKLFLEFEGEDEFNDLQEEVNRIVQNKDYNWYLKQAITDEIPNINMERLKGMMNSIIKHKL